MNAVDSSQGPRDAFFLIGPTASGKSGVAQLLAERMGAAILSADSMLIYRGMDIGTAKPTEAERAGVPYYGVDLAGPGERFSVWQYRQYALAVCRQESRPLIVVGGTGLYVKALIDGLSETPGRDEARQKRWWQCYEREGLAALQQALCERDAAGYAAFPDKENPRRLVRALEVLEGGGTLAERRNWQARSEPSEDVDAPAAPAPTPVAGLRLPVEWLAKRIEERVRAMMAGGLLEEARALLATHDGRPEGTGAQAIGYAEAFDYIEGKCTLEVAVERICIRTRRLAKRQRTWFRHQAQVAWVDVASGESTAVVAERVAGVWGEYGPTAIRVE